MAEVKEVDRSSQAYQVTDNQPVDNQQPGEQPQETASVEETNSNGNTLRGEVNQYGMYQRMRIAGDFNNDEGDDSNLGSTVTGATNGGRAAITEINEQGLRNSGSVSVSGNQAFINRVAQDLDRIAPGTTVDANGVVQRAPIRVSGHQQGYQLVDQLINNPNPITIRHAPGNAFAEPVDWQTLGPQGTLAGGTPGKPGAGTAVDVYYDPYSNFSLPTLQSNGTIVDLPADSAIILAHELSHASHGQRGTIDVRVGTPPGQAPNAGTTTDNHYFTNNGQPYRELTSDRVFVREEWRTVGFNGYRASNEPTENSIRSELGLDRRAAYMGSGQYQAGNQILPGHEPVSTLDAIFGRTELAAGNFGNQVVDGVRHSGSSAAIGGGVALFTSTYQQIANGRPLDEALPAIAQDTAIGAGTGVMEEVIERVVSGTPAVTSGSTNSFLRVAANQTRGAAVAGAVTNTVFAVADNWDNLQNDATRSQAIGNIAGEAAVGAASGLAGAWAGAAAGAALGSVVPGVGTVVGGVVGFAAGAAAGWLTDQGLRAIGVNNAIATGVTAVADFAGNAWNTAGEAISGFAQDPVGSISNVATGAVDSLKSLFGW
jgi:hypothetical protein